MCHSCTVPNQYNNPVITKDFDCECFQFSSVLFVCSMILFSPQDGQVNIMQSFWVGVTSMLTRELADTAKGENIRPKSTLSSCSLETYTFPINYVTQGCRRSVVASGYSGFLHQWNWHFIIIISPPRYEPGPYPNAALWGFPWIKVFLVHQKKKKIFFFHQSRVASLVTFS